MKRRSIIKRSLTAGLGIVLSPVLASDNELEHSFRSSGNSEFEISLAEWSLRDWLNSGKISNLEFPATAKNVFGINAVEYVSRFFDGKETDQSYLRQLKQLTADENVKNVLIMVDMWGPEGSLASPDQQKRKAAAQNHHKWIDAAMSLGCHAIRVNASGYEDAGYEDSKKYFVDGLRPLVEYGKRNQINVLVENHGGYSSNGRWLAEVMQEVNDPNCGTLPDFGNFRVSKEQGIFYDPLIGLSELMPYAKGISAKASQFDAKGNETTIDYPKMMQIIKTAGFSGYIGIEWGGGGYTNMEPEEGVKATKNLLLKLINDDAK